MMMTSLYSHSSERTLISTLAKESQIHPNLVNQLISKHKLSASDMELPAHRDLLRSLLETVRRGSAATLEILSAGRELTVEIHRAGGRQWIEDILNTERGSMFELPALIEILQGLSLRRRLYALAERMASLAQDPHSLPAESIIASAREMTQLTGVETHLRRLSDVLADTKEAIHNVQNGTALLCIPTGLRMLDRVISGWQRSVLTVIGAGPGVGKSALLGTTIDSMARSGVKVGVFSLEDSAEWLVYRILSKHSSLAQPVIKYRVKSEIEQNALASAYESLNRYAANVILDDRPALTSEEIALTARDMILNHQCDIIIVDHVGEIHVSNHARERHDLNIASAMADLRDIAKVFRVPVLVATQLKAGADPAKPAKTDIANSYDIARMARVILILARKSDTEALLTVVKQTEGPADIAVPIEFIPHAGLFRSA